MCIFIKYYLCIELFFARKQRVSYKWRKFSEKLHHYTELMIIFNSHALKYELKDRNTRHYPTKSRIQEFMK